jgi:hypothetical protein
MKIVTQDRQGVKDRYSRIAQKLSYMKKITSKSQIKLSS